MIYSDSVGRNIDGKKKFHIYMYYVLVLFALASNIAPIGTLTAIILGGILVIYHRVAFKEWPMFDRGLAKVFGIYFLVWIVIALNSTDVMVSIKDVFSTFYRIFPLFFVMMGLRNRSQLKRILLAFGVSVLITDFVAVYQYLVNGATVGFRPEGMSNHPIHLASHIIMALSVGVAVLLDKGFSKKWKIIVLCINLFSMLVLVATMTRGVWCAFVFMAILFTILYPYDRIKVFKGMLIVAIAGLLIFISNATLQARVQSIFSLQHVSNTERILMWKSSIEMLKDYPTFGIGPNRFQYVYNTQYINPQAKERSAAGQYKKGHSHPHNNFLKRLAEGGVVGGLAFVLLNIYIFKHLYKIFKKKINGQRINVYAMMGLVLFAGMHIAGLTDSNVIIVPEMRELWFLIGLFMVADDLKCSD